MDIREEKTDSRWVALGAIEGCVRLRHEAMATIFEIIISYFDAAYARQAGEAAFTELESIESALSRYISNSDISRLNAAAPGESVLVGPDAFACLETAARLQAETAGAFNLAAGASKDHWLAAAEAGRPERPPPVGGFELDAESHTVARTTAETTIDLGGIGKGFAIDKMAELLREWEISSALLHGGYSSVLALEAPGSSAGWPVTISDPVEAGHILKKLSLRNSAMGASGMEKGPHIIDPRSGRPVEGRIASWAFAPDATEADALSTAFMVMKPKAVERYCRDHPGTAALIVTEEGEKMFIGGCFEG
jgi:thiamine biosynthesis lipoprotein